MKLRAPVQIRCRYIKGKENGITVHTCVDCGGFTANLPLYRYDVCPKKERRKRKQGRREGDYKNLARPYDVD